jgi:hypothetical protein
MATKRRTQRVARQAARGTRREKTKTPLKATPATKKPSSLQTTARKRALVRPKSADVGAREKPPGRPEQRRAFFSDARHTTDALAEELGESFVLSATSGEDSEEYFERERPEEEGGPFLETTARTEFAYGTDESNPEDAEPAPWPAVSPGQPPPHRSGGPR